MAIQGVGQGFFSSNGELKSSNLSSSTNTSSTTTTSEDVTSSAQIATAASVADAAVVKITSQLNVAGTGFDSGVSAIVGQAIASYLENQSSNQTEPSTTSISDNSGTASQSLSIGGSYQNSIINPEAKEK